MADDTINIVQPLDFHPCNSPRGMLYYDLKVLTIDQQVQLNLLKRDSIRENEKYLARHPEIRALIALITHHVLLYRPRTNLHEFISNFFSRPKPDILDEMQQYIEAREPHVYEGDSAVLLHEESTAEGTSTEEIEEEEEALDLEALPREILDEILQKAYTRLGIDSDDTTERRTTISPSGMSVIKEVISEVIEKAMKKERTDVLQYLLKSEHDQHEGSEAVEGLSYRQTEIPSGLLWVTDLETEQDVLDDTIVFEELLATDELADELIEAPIDGLTQEDVEVPQTEETVTLDPISETVTDVKQETEDQTEASLEITIESNLEPTDASELNESPTTDAEAV